MSNFSIDFEHLYEINISKYIGKENLIAVYDIIRMICLQVMVQFMLYLRDPKSNPFFNGAFFEMLFYIILAIQFYYLVLLKIVKFI